VARLEAISKGLFYPSPMRVVEMIADAIDVRTVPQHVRLALLRSAGPVPERGALLDPCAGTGEPAAYLASRWGLASYGVELHAERVTEAAARLDHCLHGSYHQIVAEPRDCSSVLFLNPPYDDEQDDDGVSARQEVLFLHATLDFLVHDGLLVYVVPRRILRNRSLVDLFRRHFRRVQVWNFPEPEVEAFGQVVVAARMYRPEYGGYGYYGEVSALEADDFPVLGSEPYRDVDETEIDLPVRVVEKFSLAGTAPEDICPSHALDDPSGAYASQQWLALTGDRDEAADAPLMAPRPGHQAMLLAAGQLNGLELDGCLVKGGSEKVVSTIEHENETVERERIVSHLSVLSLQTGDLDTWRVDENPQKTSDWFRRHGDDLARGILSSHAPSFDGDVSDLDFSRLRAPGLLPGRSEPELLEVQKQAAAAVLHRWRRFASAIISGEMGLGKSAIAICACELAGHERVVVVCPSHLVPKWIRECEAVTGQPGVAVTAKKVSEVDAFFHDDPEPKDGILGMLRAVPTRPRYLVLSKEMAKLGSRWVPAFNVRHRTIVREVKLRDVDHPYSTYRTKIVREREPVVSCPCCGAMQMVLENLALSPRSMDEKTKRQCTECEAPLWTNVPLNAKGTKRWPLARFVNRRHANRYALVIDEAHMFKAAESDQSRAIQWLASGATKVLAMTGTLYGGRASSIFHLLYKVEESFRRVYRHDQCPRFVEHHGLFETVYKEEESTSVYGYRRGRTGGRVREIPGMSPAMIPILLPYTVFVKLRDLRMELPPYHEEVVLVDHDHDVEWEARSMADEVRTVVRKYPSILGQYLMCVLGYPDRPDQEERIVVPESAERDPGMVVAEARAFQHQLWPKDEKVVEIAVAEKKAGRKVLVFFSQTHRRDARGRVKAALEGAGMRVAVLGSNVPPEKREQWLRDAEDEGFDAMLTNGRLVETGMDLLFAHTIIQYGIEYSLATLRQSVRRSWRLGQTRPVRVVFLGYRRTMQETALNLIARKMRAAEMIDGDEAGGLAQHDDGGANFLVELAHEVLGRETPARTVSGRGRSAG